MMYMFTPEELRELLTLVVVEARVDPTSREGSLSQSTTEGIVRRAMATKLGGLRD